MEPRRREAEPAQGKIRQSPESGYSPVDAGQAHAKGPGEVDSEQFTGSWISHRFPQDRSGP